MGINRGYNLRQMFIKPVRYQHQKCLHFITFSCYHRLELLDSDSARDTFERELERVRRWYGCFVAGYVVMPEHVHLLISEPERGELSLVIQMLKQITSRQLRPPSQPRFWQVRYYDFPVWTEAKRIEKLRYIHRNPVHRGLVTRPEDWRWSSFVHHATGEQRVVEIESEWTARKRESLGIPLAVGNSHPPAKNAGRMGQPPFYKPRAKTRNELKFQNWVAPPFSRSLRKGALDPATRNPNDIIRIWQRLPLASRPS